MLTRPYKVLIVDDDVQFLELLRDSISTVFSDKLTLDSSNNPQQAIAILKEQEINIVLTDINMPQMKGDVFLREALSIRPSLQVIVLTSDETFTIAMTCYLDGASLFLKKPYKLSDIKAALGHVVNQLDQWHDLFHKKSKKIM